MKRFAVLAMYLGLAAVAAPAAEGPGEGGSMEWWKWANFIVLAGVLGYMAGRKAPAFFAARSRQIRKDMVEADESRREAEARAAEVDRRLANLETEIAALRAEAQQEGHHEMQVITHQTALDMAKMQAHAEQEIAQAGKAARLELKRHAAELAMGLAEQKIRTRLTPSAQDGLVSDFVRDLK